MSGPIGSTSGVAHATVCFTVGVKRTHPYIASQYMYINTRKDTGRSGRRSSSWRTRSTGKHRYTWISKVLQRHLGIASDCNPANTGKTPVIRHMSICVLANISSYVHAHYVYECLRLPFSAAWLCYNM